MSPSTPSPPSQNLGEAEYVVSTFMYLRLLGYPAESISIITPYNGQRALIADVVSRRCAPYAEFGNPGKIATTDKFQGQQNDFILLSLVRTKHVGHIRDVRRLVVSVSRARLGLLVFGDRQLYEQCEELKPALSQLLSVSDKLQLLPAERYPTSRLVSSFLCVYLFVCLLYEPIGERIYICVYTFFPTSATPPANW
ncbi:AAA domain-containing protein [Pavlovales sp. CCMP2436]|nr:AAA domain-containing protein [Pavlovales sp. CCMP2436]